MYLLWLDDCVKVSPSSKEPRLCCVAANKRHAGRHNVIRRSLRQCTVWGCDSQCSEWCIDAQTTKPTRSTITRDGWTKLHASVDYSEERFEQLSITNCNLHRWYQFDSRFIPENSHISIQCKSNITMALLGKMCPVLTNLLSILTFSLLFISSVQSMYLPGLAPVSFCKKEIEEKNSETDEACKVSIKLSNLTIWTSFFYCPCQSDQTPNHYRLCCESSLTLPYIYFHSVCSITAYLPGIDCTDY